MSYAILFYRNSGSIPDELITLWEGNKHDFVHCAIQVNETQKIEAVYPRIVLSTINQDRVAATYPITKQVDTVDLDWIYKEVGQPYSEGDILDVIFNHPIFEQHFDCSALATSFLRLIGDPHIPANANVHMVTPQLLANFLGVH